MLIVGAGGFAKELLQILHWQKLLEELAFYDDINVGEETMVFEKFSILRSENEVKNHFSVFGNRFIIGIGHPILRYKMFRKFESLEGTLTSCISPFARIGNYDVHIGEGTSILDHAIVSNGVKIGIGCVIYYNAVVTHDCVLGKFVEVSPSANMLGRCRIGDFTHVGSNATILPGIRIGENVIIGAGAVVTKDVPDNCVAIGVPASIKKIMPGLILDLGNLE